MTSLTYSHTLLVPLTRSCGASCQYCTFKNDDPHLLTFDEMEDLIRRHVNSGLCEVMLASGQSLDAVAKVRQQWMDRGYASFVHYVRDLCQLVLENQLIPSLQIGPLAMPEMETLAEYVPSFRLSLENINAEFCKTIQSEKSLDAKVESLSDAGLIQWPTTTGLLLGLGEDLEDCIDTLDAIAEVHGRYRHIQNVVFQHVVGSDDPPVRAEDLERLIGYARRVLPDVRVSMPASAPGNWLDTLVPQIDDLDNVFEGYDGLRWDRSFEKLAEIQRDMQRRGRSLRPRFPVFDHHFRTRSMNSSLQSVLGEWLNKKDFAYYL